MNVKVAPGVKEQILFLFGLVVKDGGEEEEEEDGGMIVKCESWFRRVHSQSDWESAIPKAMLTLRLKWPWLLNGEGQKAKFR